MVCLILLAVAVGEQNAQNEHKGEWAWANVKANGKVFMHKEHAHGVRANEEEINTAHHPEIRPKMSRAGAEDEGGAHHPAPLEHHPAPQPLEVDRESVIELMEDDHDPAAYGVREAVIELMEDDH